MLTALLAVAAGPAVASPLGLQAGDVIDTIAWDTVSDSGLIGFFDQNTQEIATTGVVTNVSVQRAPAYPPTLTNLGQSGVTFDFAAELFYASAAGGMLNVQFTSSSLTDPDVTVYQNGNVILTGDFLGNFVFAGSLLSSSLISAGTISVTGGDPNLVAAIGNTAILNLSATVGDFMPNLATIAAAISGNTIGTNFTVEFSGTLRPASSAPFVPEPSTALLLGAGMLGLLGMSRRVSRR